MSELWELWRSLRVWWMSRRQMRHSDSDVTSGKDRLFSDRRSDRVFWSLVCSVGPQNDFSQLSSIFFKARRSRTTFARSWTFFSGVDVSSSVCCVARSAAASRGGSPNARSSTKSKAGEFEPRGGAAYSAGNGCRLHKDCKSYHRLSMG